MRIGLYICKVNRGRLQLDWSHKFPAADVEIIKRRQGNTKVSKQVTNIKRNNSEKAKNGNCEVQLALYAWGKNS